jgi:hypothetical protein
METATQNTVTLRTVDIEAQLVQLGAKVIDQQTCTLPTGWTVRMIRHLGAPVTVHNQDGKEVARWTGDCDCHREEKVPWNGHNRFVVHTSLDTKQEAATTTTSMDVEPTSTSSKRKRMPEQDVDPQASDDERRADVETDVDTDVEDVPKRRGEPPGPYCGACGRVKCSCDRKPAKRRKVDTDEKKANRAPRRKVDKKFRVTASDVKFVEQAARETRRLEDIQQKWRKTKCRLLNRMERTEPHVEVMEDPTRERKRQLLETYLAKSTPIGTVLRFHNHAKNITDPLDECIKNALLNFVDNLDEHVLTEILK